MMHGLNLDKKDPNYSMLKQIFKIIDSRNTHQIFARNGIKPLDKFCTTIKTIFISYYFDLNISFVANQLKTKPRLCSFFNIKKVLDASQVYEILSRFSPLKIQKSVNSILKQNINLNKRTNRTFIVDATPLDLDYNFNSRKISKKSLEKKDAKWAHGTSIGFYIGFKATFVLDYETKLPINFIIHSGSPHDSTIFTEILDTLKKQHILKFGDKILFDRGYYKYDNYRIGIRKYNIIPLILPKAKFNVNKLDDLLIYPLECFYNTKESKELKRKYKQLVNSFRKNIKNKAKIKYERSSIEDFFKLLKRGLSMRHLHKYTRKSVQNRNTITVLLAGLIIQQGYHTKSDLQRLAEGQII